MLPVFDIIFGDVSPYNDVEIIFSSVNVAEWPPFGTELLTRLTVCSLSFICIFSISRFGFEDRVWVLILLYTYKNTP